MKTSLLIFSLLLVSCGNSINIEGVLPRKDDKSKLHIGTFKNWESHKFLCGISITGKTKCWGSGHLGNGELTSGFSGPVDIEFSGASSLVTIDTTACAIKSGAVYCWGLNFNMEAASSSRTPIINPSLVSSLNSGVSKIDGSSLFFCALKEGGVYCWGYNVDDVLKPDDTAYPFVASPTVVEGVKSGVTDMAVGKNHICAVKEKTLFCWGSQVEGELGNGLLASFERSPTPVVNMSTGVTKVWASHGHYANPGSSTCALKDGLLYCWGNNDIKQLGFTSTSSRVRPTLHPLSNKGVKDLLLNGPNGCLITSSDEVWCWGFHVNAAGFIDPELLVSSEPVKMINVPSGITRLVGDGRTLCYQTKTEAKCHGHNPDFEIDLTGLNHTVPVDLDLLD